MLLHWQARQGQAWTAKMWCYERGALTDYGARPIAQLGFHWLGLAGQGRTKMGKDSIVESGASRASPIVLLGYHAASRLPFILRE
jgi:hypothetical protein